jgi:8-oxo-dGTP pyrophosphatase MutT (NUDIX family)
MTGRDDLQALLLTPEEAIALDAPGSKEAAVLVPLYRSGTGLRAIFTRRRDDLEHHPGEISFPGGRRNGPEEHLRETALREAEEEIGLPRAEVDVVGALPPVGTFVTSYRVHPFVGLLPSSRTWTLQPDEVDEVLDLSLADLLSGFEMKRLLGKGVPIRTATYTVDGHLVWGATARMVQLLLERLAPVL